LFALRAGQRVREFALLREVTAGSPLRPDLGERPEHCTLLGDRLHLVTAKFGLSAAMLAVLTGYEDVARELASAGADLRLTGTGAPGFAGRTAADLARERGLFALVRDLSPLEDSC
jgi:hypothetical protein